MRTDYIRAEKTINGAYEVTGYLRDNQGYYFHSKRYYGYTKREALALFRDEYQEKLVKA